MMHCKIKMMFPHKIYAEYLQKDIYTFYIWAGPTSKPALTLFIILYFKTNSYLWKLEYKYAL